MSAPKATGTATTTVKVSRTGRLSLPADVRRQMGLENGGTVVVDASDGEVRLRTVDEIFARARVKAREMLGKGASVDEFLKSRRTLWDE